jgi:hypothetical protein
VLRACQAGLGQQLEQALRGLAVHRFRKLLGVEAVRKREDGSAGQYLDVFEVERAKAGQRDFRTGEERLRRSAGNSIELERHLAEMRLAAERMLRRVRDHRELASAWHDTVRELLRQRLRKHDRARPGGELSDDRHMRIAVHVVPHVTGQAAERAGQLEYQIVFGQIRVVSDVPAPHGGSAHAGDEHEMVMPLARIGLCLEGDLERTHDRSELVVTNSH